MPLRQRPISLSELACQAQAAKQAEVLELVRQGLSQILKAVQDQAVERERHQRIGPGAGKIYRWGYLVRKGWETSWGRLGEVRIPRVRGPEGEIRLVAKFERKLARLVEQWVLGFGQGMSLRGIAGWLKGLGLPQLLEEAVRLK
jgi:hypothetical protein